MAATSTPPSRSLSSPAAIVGLVTHSAVGRFDKVFLGVPIGDQSFLETVRRASVRHVHAAVGTMVRRERRLSEQRNSADEHHAGAVRHGHRSSEHGHTLSFTFRARLLNPYANSGNLVGIVFNYAGEAPAIRRSSSRPRALQGSIWSRTASSTRSRRQTMAGAAMSRSRSRSRTHRTVVSVLVNGVRLFENVAAANPNMFPEGGVGLITHWAPGRFDNVQFDHGALPSLHVNVRRSAVAILDRERLMEHERRHVEQHRGRTKATSSSSTAHVAERYRRGRRHRRRSTARDCSTNSARRAIWLGWSTTTRIRSASTPGDYFEIVFSPTGIMQLNKFIQGVRYPVAHADAQHPAQHVVRCAGDSHRHLHRRSSSMARPSLQLRPKASCEAAPSVSSRIGQGDVSTTSRWPRRVSRPPSEL